jgi:hypothetical protein
MLFDQFSNDFSRNIRPHGVGGGGGGGGDDDMKISFCSLKYINAIQEIRLYKVRILKQIYEDRHVCPDFLSSATFQRFLLLGRTYLDIFFDNLVSGSQRGCPHRINICTLRTSCIKRTYDGVSNLMSVRMYNLPHY